MSWCPVLFQTATEGIPVGGIILWSGAANAIPTGWALCNGSNGTPDLRGRFVLGAGGSYAVGAKGGEEKHTLTVAEMPSHSHRSPIAIPSSITVLNPKGDNGSGNYADTSATGGSQAHNNMPPYYALCYIMKL